MIRLREIITRIFSFARPGNWWFSKVPPLLAVAYLAILFQDIDLSRAGLLLASFVVSVSCVAIYGHVINDAFDIEDDRRAGKPNAMAALNRSGRCVLILTFLCAGFVPAVVIKGEELRKIKREAQQRSIAAFQGPIHAPDNWWQDNLFLERGSQAWFVVDPADGKIPPMTRRGQAAHRGAR